MTEDLPEELSGAASQNLQEELSLDAQGRLAQRVMRQQGKLSLQVAALFIVLLLGLPLINLYQPELASTQIFGFSATWLFLGILFYPITILLSVYFVRESDRIEAAAAKSHKQESVQVVQEEGTAL